MNVSDQTLVLGDLAGPIGAALIGVALVLLLMAVLRPRWVWPLLVIGAIVGSGPKVKGYVIFDELFLLVLVGGACLALAVGGLQQRDRPLGHEQPVLFITWAVFMVVQSARGILAENDPRILRWAAMYLALAVLAHLIRRYRFRRPENPYAVIVGATIALYVVYAAVGWYYESTFGPGGRYNAQGFAWAGTASAVFPTLLAFPSALLLLERPGASNRVLAVIGILVMVGIGWYYDSRLSWLAFAVYTAVWCSRRLLLMATVATAATLMLLAVNVTSADFGDYFSDQTRPMQLSIAIDAAADDWVTAAIGAGVYVHRTLLTPYAQRVFDRDMSDEKLGTMRDYDGQLMQRSFGGVYRTTGLPAFFIDTGVLGLGLLGWLFCMRAWTIARSRSSSRRLWLAALGFGAMTLVIFNPIDLVLFYMMVLPHGLLDELAEADPDPVRRAVSRQVAPRAGALVAAR